MTDRQNEAPLQNGALPPRPEPPPNIELRPGVKIPMPKPLGDYGYIRRP